MNCLSDGMLQARLDNELPTAELEQVDQHLAACAGCRGRLDMLQSRAGSVRQALARLAPQPGQTVDAARAFTRFRAALDEQPEPARNWLGRVFAPRLRPAWGGLALICAIAVFLSVAPARTFAEKVLAMLRVKKIAVVSV